jgi:hypothetical protein
MILRTLILWFFIKLSLFACAGGWDYNQKEFVFLENRNMPFSNISEEINSANVYNTILWAYEEKNKEENLKEWKKELKDEYSINEIEDFVYKRINLEKLKDKEILDYINLVKEQEKHVTNDYYMGEEEKKKLKKYTLILNETLKKIDTVNSSWLKLRYFYLSLRLAHYKKENPLKIYEKYKYLLENKDKTIVKDWIQGLYAGALVKNKQVEKGVYEFSKLFDKDKINSHLSYYNFFHIKSDTQWNELLNLANTNEEKTKFFALRALNENSNILEELQNIYSLDKNSKWFDFTLFRELLNTQHFFDQSSEYERNFPYKKYIEFLQTVQKDDMYLVKLSLAYFNLYEKNYKESSKLTDELIKDYPSSHEVQTLSYILYLEQLEKIDTTIENSIYDKMIKLTKNETNSNSIHNYTFVVLEKLYLKQNDKFNSFLANHINYLDLATFDLELLEKFRIFMENPKDSKIKEHFANKYLEQKMIKKQDNKFVLDENLQNTKTKLLINNLKFEEALNLNSSLLNEKVQFNPFNGLIRGNNRSGKQNTMSIKEFLDKTLVIQKELEKNPKSVMDNYLFANALYNLSYFGNSNILTTVYRSVYSFNDYDLQKEKINLAIKYYTIALEESKEKEFKAKITYMLSKAELALFDINYSTKMQDYYNKDLNRYDLERYWFYNKKVYDNYIKNSYGKYFDMLKNDYSNTKYYKELIHECANLRIYQKHK